MIFNVLIHFDDKGILGDGFRDWRFGDRFWYETNDPLTGFKIDQLNEIKKARLARLVCDNTDLQFIQENPLLEARKNYNELVNCENLPHVDLSVFKVKKNEYEY